MRVRPYRMHCQELGQHVINGIPPHADITQELQGFDLGNLRWLPFCEPPILVAMFDSWIEGVSMLTWSLNGSDHCTSLQYGIRRNNGIIRWIVTIIIGNSIRCGEYSPSRAKIDDISETDNMTIVWIKGNVMQCKHSLERRHHGLIIGGIIESKMPNLVE